MSFVTPKPACPTVEKKPGCIQAALEILGDKWTPLLLGQLASGSKTFGELESELAGISPRTLSDRLEKLLTESVAVKEMYCKHPPRYRYNLTPKGVELIDILVGMSEWGEKYGK